MKPLFILLTLVSSLFAQAKTNPEDVAPAARKSFERTFSSATQVQWTASENMYKVSFQVAGQYASAYYNENGSLVVVTRNLSPLQLPVVLLAAVKKDYQGQWISDLVEVADDNGVHYYITLEDATQKVILKSDGASFWTRYQRTEK